MTWMDLGADQDIYLARVNWLPDGKTLAMQRESRDQRRLDLLFADIDTGETGRPDRNQRDLDRLNDELSFLKQSPEFIWASAATAISIFICTTTDGHLIRQLDCGRLERR